MKQVYVVILLYDFLFFKDKNFSETNKSIEEIKIRFFFEKL